MGFVKEVNCIFCSNNTETGGHIFWGLSIGNGRLGRLGACWMSIQKSHMEGMDFREILEGIIHPCCKEDVCLLVVLAKKIWMKRNVAVHGGVFSHQIV